MRGEKGFQSPIRLAVSASRRTRLGRELLVVSLGWDLWGNLKIKEELITVFLIDGGGGVLYGTPQEPKDIGTEIPRSREIRTTSKPTLWP